MLNILWLGLMLASVVLGFWHHCIPQVVASVADSATAAVTLAIGLVGIMALWLGIMKIAEEAGFIQAIGRGLRPILRWLFPQVPEEHPALGAITLNIAANMLGLGNAATPFGLRAMEALEKINPVPGTATDAMCMFVAINTASVQLIPATAIAILAANGDPTPTAIIAPTLIATFCAALTGVTAAKIFSKLSCFKVQP